MSDSLLKVTQSVLRQLTPAQCRAIMAEAHRQAIDTIKHELRAQGRQPQHMARREIELMAEDYLAQHRDQLLCAAFAKYMQRAKADLQASRK